MPTESELRDRIVARAREALHHGVQADVGDRDGLRTGWQFLQKYFSVAPCSPFASVRKYARHAVKVKVNNEETTKLTYHIAPDWCGIFALWCLHAARPDEYVGHWISGSCIQSVSGVERLQPSQIQLGDVGIMNGKNVHHVLITEVIGDPPAAVRTIEGNSGLHSEVTEPMNPKSIRDFALFATIFGAAPAADVEKRLLGAWSVTIDWKPWIYIFSKPDQVAYAETSNPRNQLGYGTWSTDGKKLRISWSSGSQEVWDLPLPHTRQSATGAWRNNAGRSSPVTYRKVE